jgi:hypothetical protein
MNLGNQLRADLPAAKKLNRQERHDAKTGKLRQEN